MIKFLKRILDHVGMWILVLPFIIVPMVYIIIGIVGTVTELREKNANNDGEAYSDDYDAGYSNGWVDGKTEADIQWFDYGDEMYENGMDKGYELGYEEGAASCDAARHFEQEAEDYAREKSGWHPEEAWYVIEAYQNHDAWSQDGSAPTAQDYAEAIDSIIYFYEYFYGGNYE